VRDYDLTHVAPLFVITVGGQQRTVIALTGRDGVLRVSDRDTREVLYSVPFTTRENISPSGIGCRFSISSSLDLWARWWRSRFKGGSTPFAIGRLAAASCPMVLTSSTLIDAQQPTSIVS